MKIHSPKSPSHKFRINPYRIKEKKELDYIKKLKKQAPSIGDDSIAVVKIKELEQFIAQEKAKWIKSLKAYQNINGRWRKAEIIYGKKG